MSFDRQHSLNFYHSLSHSLPHSLLLLLLLLAPALSALLEPVTNSERKSGMEDSLLNPPWQVTDPNNLNPLGLPAEMASGTKLRGGAYPNGRSIATQKYGLINNPQNVHAIGPTFGIHGGIHPPTDRPRFYPSDFLTAPEALTVTPPKSYTATNINFNPNKEDGMTPGEMEPVHPVPCSTAASDGSGLCNTPPPPVTVTDGFDEWRKISFKPLLQ